MVVPMPGSEAALRRGCTCSAADNARGNGIPRDGKTAFWITKGCPLHDAPRQPPEMKGFADDFADDFGGDGGGE
ncbi:MAG: hypothetical protein O2905_05340 [Proteobacteria bacterium]|nr:hypothetical protein [Pseudomonadota bacterium]MDA1132630.1 hypothetical protein [Pseudomonadota bacterium]